MKTLRFTDAPARAFDPRAPKFGGQPLWLDEPAWPLSRSTGRLMRFICQVPIPPGFAGDKEVAYVFYAGGDEYADRGWEARGGENAVILQPGEFRPVVPTKPVTIGPVLQELIHDQGRRFLDDVELHAEIVELDLEPDRPTMQYLGAPFWIQCDDTPTRGPWRLLLQIDSATDRFRLNLGDAGVAYVFVSEDGRSARFLWQCY